MARERIKELTVKIERLLKDWEFTNCGNKQSDIATELEIAAGELRTMGVKSIYAERPSGSLGNLNVDTLMFER